MASKPPSPDDLKKAIDEDPLALELDRKRAAEAAGRVPGDKPSSLPPKDDGEENDGELVGALRACGIDAWGIENNRAIHAKTPKELQRFNKLGSIVDMPFRDGEFDFVFETSLCHLPEKQVPRAIRELNRVIKTGLVFGSVTSDMAPTLIDRYDLLRGIKKLGTWWEWSELFFGNGFDLSMHRRDCTDALWAATLAADKGPGQWYADSESLRYSFFDKIEADDD